MVHVDSYSNINIHIYTNPTNHATQSVNVRATVVKKLDLLQLLNEERKLEMGITRDRENVFSLSRVVLLIMIWSFIALSTPAHFL